MRCALYSRQVLPMADLPRNWFDSVQEKRTNSLAVYAPMRYDLYLVVEKYLPGNAARAQVGSNASHCCISVSVQKFEDVSPMLSVITLGFSTFANRIHSSPTSKSSCPKCVDELFHRAKASLASSVLG